jgi:hypothetical protein
MFPAIPAAPLPASPLATSAVCVAKPSFEAVTEKLSLRGNENVHGVAGQVNPCDVFTAAPTGVVSTTNCCVVPRVSVAHAVLAPAIVMMATTVMKFFNWNTPVQPLPS